MSSSRSAGVEHELVQRVARQQVGTGRDRVASMRRGDRHEVRAVGQRAPARRRSAGLGARRRRLASDRSRRSARPGSRPRPRRWRSASRLATASRAAWLSTDVYVVVSTDANGDAGRRRRLPARCTRTASRRSDEKPGRGEIDEVDTRSRRARGAEPRDEDHEVIARRAGASPSPRRPTRCSSTVTDTTATSQHRNRRGARSPTSRSSSAPRGG